MKLRISHYEIPVRFIEMEKDSGSFEIGNDGIPNICIHKGLRRGELVNTLFHEVGHLAYHLYQPKGEEAQVSAVTNVWVEALTRNKWFRELILENL